jgi:hypothetical protein
MPVLKIFYTETLDDAARDNSAVIQRTLEGMMLNTLHADPANCQIILVSAVQIAPMPVYVDIQFRANEHRTRDVVSNAMEEVAEVLLRTFGTSIRIRAFDIDQAALHAFDVERPDA